MKKKTITGIVTVPHKERPASLEVEITGIPQWKQDIYNLVAELTKYRLRNKITQKELAERLKVSQSVIARFEKLGRYPTIEFLYKVAGGLGMQIEISANVIPQVHDVKENNVKTSISTNSGEFTFCNEGFFNTMAPTIEKKDMQNYWNTIINGKISIDNKTYKDTKVANEYILLFKCSESNVKMIDKEQTDVQTNNSQNESQPLAA